MPLARRGGPRQTRGSRPGIARPAPWGCGEAGEADIVGVDLRGAANVRQRAQRALLGRVGAVALAGHEKIPVPLERRAVQVGESSGWRGCPVERRLPTAGAATVRDIGRSRRSSAILENGCESSFHAGGEAEGARRDRQPGARAERQKGGSVGGKAWVCGGHLRGRLRFWGQDMPAESSPTSASVTGGDSRAELSNASTQGLPSTRRRRSS